MERARWTWWFMWFGPLERNTLRPQESCCIVVFFKLALHWSEWTSTSYSHHPPNLKGRVVTL
jgi:hypothetical protein